MRVSVRSARGATNPVTHHKMVRNCLVDDDDLVELPGQHHGNLPIGIRTRRWRSKEDTKSVRVPLNRRTQVKEE